MKISSHDYLMPLVHARMDGRWGTPHRDVLEGFCYRALELIALEQGLPFRRVKLATKMVGYSKYGNTTTKEAVIPAMILFKGDQPVLCDLYGNQTPTQVIKAFANDYDLDRTTPAAMKKIDAWKDAAAFRYPRIPGGRERAASILDKGRALLQAYHLQSIPLASSSTNSPSRRM